MALGSSFMTSACGSPLASRHDRRFDKALHAVIVGVSFAVLSAGHDAEILAQGGVGSPSADLPASARSGAAPQGNAGTVFPSQEISIGEPISLPQAAPLPLSRPSPTVPAVMPSSAAPPAAGTGWLGIAVDDTLLTGRLVVVEVAPGSPAAMAGLRPQDVLLAINGSQLHTADEMAAVLAAITPGQRVKAAVGRDSRVDDLELTAMPRPADAVARAWQPADVPASQPAAARVAAAEVPRQPSAPQPQPANAKSSGGPAGPPLSTGQPRQLSAETAAPAAVASLPSNAAHSSQSETPTASGGRLALGVRTVPVDPATQSRFQLPDHQGAFVIGVVNDLPAAKAGIPPGSVIVAINQQPVRSPQELTQLVTHGPAGRPVPLNYVLPGGQTRQTSVILQSLDEPLERALVGPVGAAPTGVPPTLDPVPLIARRPLPAPETQPRLVDTLERLHETVHRMSAEIERLQRRLERIESGR